MLRAGPGRKRQAPTHPVAGEAGRGQAPAPGPTSTQFLSELLPRTRLGHRSLGNCHGGRERALGEPRQLSEAPRGSPLQHGLGQGAERPADPSGGQGTWTGAGRRHLCPRCSRTPATCSGTSGPSTSGRGRTPAPTAARPSPRPPASSSTSTSTAQSNPSYVSHPGASRRALGVLGGGPSRAVPPAGRPHRRDPVSLESARGSCRCRCRVSPRRRGHPGAAWSGRPWVSGLARPSPSPPPPRCPLALLPEAAGGGRWEGPSSGPVGVLRRSRQPLPAPCSPHSRPPPWAPGATAAPDALADLRCPCAQRPLGCPGQQSGGGSRLWMTGPCPVLGELTSRRPSRKHGRRL